MKKQFMEESSKWVVLNFERFLFVYPVLKGTEKMGAVICTVIN